MYRNDRNLNGCYGNIVPKGAYWNVLLELRWFTGIIVSYNNVGYMGEETTTPIHEG